MQQSKVSVPVSYWVVTFLGLIWNAAGGLDYTLTRLRNEAWLKAEGDPRLILAWIDSFPLWAQLAWAMGVWGAVAGSLLMVVRSRHAASAFVISLIGALASFAYQFSHLPAGMGSSGNKLIAAFVLLIIAFLFQFCRREIAKGILR